jgi:hypothetical protein
MILLAQERLDDPSITLENFRAMERFFFVNTSTGSLISSTLDLSRTLSTLSIDDGDVVELRFCESQPQFDGTILNPMRGVKTFIK